MIKESNPIRTQEKSQEKQPEGAAFHNESEGGSSLAAPQYNPASLDGAGFVQQMQTGLGTDLSGAKVVKNSQKAQSLGQPAFTDGNKIHFSPGQYQPDTKKGQDILSHELIHVAQQAKGRTKGDSSSEGAEANFENQASSESKSIQQGAMASSSLQGANVGEQQAATGPQGFFGGLMKKAKGVFSAGKNAVSKAAVGIGGMAKSVFKGGSSLLGKIGNKAKGIAGGIGDFGKKAAGGLFSKAKGIVGGIGQFGKKLGGGLANAAGGALDTGKALFNKVKSVGSGVFEGMKDLASNPIGSLQKIVQGVASKGSSAFGFLKGLGSKITKKAKGLFNKFKKIGKKGVGYLADVGKGVLGTLKSVGGGFLGGIKEMFKGNIGDGFKKMGMGLAEGIGGAIDTVLDATGGLFDSFAGPEGEEVSEDQIPSRHVMDEFTAHQIAYKSPEDLIGGAGLSPQEREILENGGYDPDNIMVQTGPNGFQATLIMPMEEGVAPMLAIRGTADLAGVITDIDPEQVGDLQYKNNAETIAGMIEAAGGKVDLSGHSLGGAMAQIIAAHHTSSVGRVTTFQSPGISSETASLYKENASKLDEENQPEVAHHIVENDLVSKAGEENLPGTFYEHDLGNIDPVTAHTSFVTGTSGFEEARNEYGITDDFMENEVGKEITDESIITKFEEQPHKYKRKMAEFVRSGVGSIRDGLGTLWNGGKKALGKAKQVLGKGKSLVKKFFGFAKKKGKAGINKVKGFFKSMFGG